MTVAAPPPFTEDDKKLIALQMAQTELAISEDQAMEAALRDQLERAKVEEALNKKIWDHYHNIILNYEKAIQYTTGVFTPAPFTEADVVDLANNTGRLYQGIVSTTAKVIPEMIGGGLASSPSPHALDTKAEIDLLIGFILSGTSASAQIYGSTKPGTVSLRSSVGSNLWVTANRVSMMLLGSPTVIPAANPVPILYQYPILRSINGVATSGSIIPWSGYTNAERTSPRVTVPSTSTQQSLMNELARRLAVEIQRWMGFLGTVIDAEANNNSPNLTDEMRKVSTDLYAYLTQYVAGYAGPEQLWLQNGPAGIDGFKAEMTKRLTVTGPALVARSKSDKELFYPARISYTNMRGDIQRGSLTTVIYLTNMLSKYPDPFLAQKKDVLALWKRQ